MSTFITGLLALVLVGLTVFLTTPAHTLANLLRSAVPVGLMVFGGILILFKQIGLGTMVMFGGLALWRRFRGVGTMGGGSGPKRSSVRSAALEMELDHDTGDINGIVLVGQFEGAVLDDLDEDALYQLRDEIAGDGDSLALLEAYLDRRFAGRREYAEADAGAGQAGPTSTGTMGEEEAYEVLGLSVGASSAEIRKAHRRLMKTAHPDSGGSTFLAAKINEAKDVLLRSHS